MFATSALLATLSADRKNGGFQAAGDLASGAAKLLRLGKDRRPFIV